MAEVVERFNGRSRLFKKNLPKLHVFFLGIVVSVLLPANFVSHAHPNGTLNADQNEHANGL